MRGQPDRDEELAVREEVREELARDEELAGD